MRMISKTFFLIFLASGCQKKSEDTLLFAWQEFQGRDEIVSYMQWIRKPVYLAKVPFKWIRIDPSENQPLLDTKIPIVTFHVDEKLILTVHTFPTEKLEDRMPVAAHVERWCTQIQDPLCVIQKIQQNAFEGLYFEGKHGNSLVCSWSMQMEIEHYQQLRCSAQSIEEEEHYKQLSADYTIIAVGPLPLIEKHRDEITLFAQSFQLIPLEF